MSHYDGHLGFDFNTRDPYYDRITELDGEDTPDEIQALIDYEADCIRKDMT